VISNFKDKRSQDIYDGLNSKETRSFPAELHKIARRKLDYINSAGKLEDLKVPPGNRLHGLKGDLKGFLSLSINDQWRIIFQWEKGNAHNVEITDYH
jgi:proteic killer suppression protein